jgi:glucuronosyltransferase
MTTRILAIVIGLSCLSVQIRAANILFLHLVPSPSHHLWNRNLMQAVASRGHNITMISPDLETTAHPNMTFIHLEQLYETVYGGGNFDIMDFAEASNARSIYQVHDLSILLCKIACNSKGLNALRNYPPEFRFDLILIDSTAGPCMLFLWERFGKPPLISVSAFSKPPFVESVMGGHKYYAYVPHPYLLSDHRNMGLFQKVNNFFLFTLDDV